MNRLTISVIEFKTLADGSTEFGFTASDEYASLYEMGWKTLDNFYEDFPTEEALKEHVLGLDPFMFMDEHENIVVEWPKG